MVLSDRIVQTVFEFLLLGCTLEKVVKHVVIALTLRQGHDSALLQQIRNNQRTADIDLTIPVQQQNQLTKTRRIIVANRLRIPERLENVIATQYLILNPLQPENVSLNRTLHQLTIGKPRRLTLSNDPLHILPQRRQKF
jgi:hypothetical protein